MGDAAHGESSCEICGNFCGESVNHDFKIDIRDESWSSAVVPCYARAYVNKVTSKYMRFQAHGRKYSVDIVKKHNRTLIKGSGWKKFMSDFSPRNGTAVLFDLCVSPRQAVVVDELSEGALADGDGSDDIIEGDTSDEDEDVAGMNIEYTRGVTLNAEREEKLNMLVSMFKCDFLGVSFVHRLTATNIQGGQMKVPHRVAISLDIAKEGLAGVRLASGEKKTHVEYNTSSDGRITFNKKHWRCFISKASLNTNDCIFMFFKTSTMPHMNVTVIVNKL